MHSGAAPISVCWDITTRCNDSCLFCYRVIDQKDLGPGEHALILKKLIDAGVRKISFVGGEPLLVPHLPALLARASNAGVITSIVTNGSLLKQRWRELHESLRWVTLPVDSMDHAVQRRMSRRQGHLQSILDTLEWLATTGVSLKINTVVGRPNIGSVETISRLMQAWPIRRWKIFQFLPVRGSAAAAEAAFGITDAEFARATDAAVRAARDHCDVTLADHEYLQRNYFSISPNGTVRTTIDGSDVIAGDLLRESVSDIWTRDAFDRAKHIACRLAFVAAAAAEQPAHPQRPVATLGAIV